jgi:hypothetical protein
MPVGLNNLIKLQNTKILFAIVMIIDMIRLKNIANFL